ncbi:uncharacterized protein LOC103524116 [Trichonephila clavipes]|nr:uncharacterized protein LOC103524116 [Trichonephila clavipes]
MYQERIIYCSIYCSLPFELLSFANPLDYAILDIRLDLVLNVRKRDLSPTALHAIALETINTRFPPEEWLHIYTDGSLLDFAQGAGIGVFSHLFSFYLHAGPLTTHFDGEVEAIHITLQQLAVRLPPIERAVILSDSTSALQALSNYNENNCLRVQNCRELLGKIKGKIVFQWVPSHCGLWGNERADFLAKKGTGILQNFRRYLTLHSAKLEIKRIFRESFRLTASRVARDKPWSTLCKKSYGIPSSPRAAAVTKFRLLTGHDCLCAHLFRFNLVTSPICVLCDTGQDMTAAHLDECSALNDLNCIVKSDEAHFWLNGYVNKQNCHIWSEANPQVYAETPLHPEKLTVWCALWASGIIGPYFFKNDEGHNVTVNVDRYRAMITNFFIPELYNHDAQELWFRQDGATCHTARATIDLLKDTFGDRLISRFGPVNWPPRSCDLTPLDYFLWLYVKSAKTGETGNKDLCVVLCWVVTNDTCLTKSGRGPRNSLRLRARILRLLLALALSTMQVTRRFCLVPLQFRGRKPWGGQGPPTSLPLPPTTREDLRLDGYLEYSHASKTWSTLNSHEKQTSHKHPCLLRDSKPIPTANHYTGWATYRSLV